MSRDIEDLKRFYEELQKRITDAIKRLTGIEHLNIWESRTSVIEIADLEAAKERIAYLYANPAQDDLEDSIELFPGYSSWSEFLRAKDTLNFRSSEQVPWIRLPSIEKLPDGDLSRDCSDRTVRLLRNRNKESEKLAIEPNGWMKAFGIEHDSDAAEINSSIESKLREREADARKRRAAEKGSVMGRHKLLRQPIMSDHIPRKRERKIFVVSACRELRKRLIDEMNEFCSKCAECYKRWSSGDLSVSWPLGAFKPPLPPLVNPLPA